MNIIEQRLHSSYTRMDEALAADPDERDDLRIAASRSGLVYAESTGDPDRITAELDRLDALWSAWATTGKWHAFEEALQDRVDLLFEALDNAMADETDEDDQQRIAAARSGLVYAVSTEDAKRVAAEVDKIEAQRAVWATSGRWPAMIIKPSGPPREDDEPSLDDGGYYGDISKQIDADWTAARWLWGGALVLGAYVVFRPRR